MWKSTKNCLVELIGTFFLMFTICCVVFTNVNPFVAPLAIGLILAVMVYAGGFISGGHYNPAVSLGAAIRGALSWKALIPYWAFQCLGAYVAVLVFQYMFYNTTPIAAVAQITAASFDMTGMILAEVIFTFALVYVVLLTATSKQTEGNSYYGFAIGTTVTAGAYAVGNISLAAFNPAVVLGLAVLGAVQCPLTCATVGANFSGAILAALVYKLINCESKK